MLKNITERLFPFLIALTALSVSASAAFYSVSGLSKLFAGARFEVIVMAGSLEFAKLVIASLLYKYRHTIPRALKYYLTVACVVLVFITSMGIYGFLSAAYQETAQKEGNRDAQIALIEVKRDNVKDQLEVYVGEKEAIDEAVVELRKGLSNNKVQWRDRETGQIITSTSSSTRKALEKQLDQAIGRQEVINDKIDVLNEKIFEFESEIVETKIGDGSTSELGPLKYLAGLTGWPMDKIINVLLLIIIFVFDPLAISLVVAANFAFERLGKRQKEWTEDKLFSTHVDDILEDDEDWEEMREWENEINEKNYEDDDDDWNYDDIEASEEEENVEYEKFEEEENVKEEDVEDFDEDEEESEEDIDGEYLLDKATRKKEIEKRDSINKIDEDDDN